jgi:predicted O-linked N-acetylglucosamine transferase (SPINDLY family)
VVTCAGRTFASRVAGSLLRAIGVPELVCRDPAEYEELIINLARDSQRLAGLRWRVRQARHQSETFDGAAAAKHLEALFERMWSRALAGLPPEHLEAEIA